MYIRSLQPKKCLWLPYLLLSGSSTVTSRGAGVAHDHRLKGSNSVVQLSADARWPFCRQWLSGGSALGQCSGPSSLAIISSWLGRCPAYGPCFTRAGLRPLSRHCFSPRVGLSSLLPALLGLGHDRTIPPVRSRRVGLLFGQCAYFPQVLPEDLSPLLWPRARLDLALLYQASRQSIHQLGCKPWELVVWCERGGSCPHPVVLAVCDPKPTVYSG